MTLMMEIAAYTVVGFGIIGVTGCAFVLTFFVYSFAVAAWRSK